MGSKIECDGKSLLTRREIAPVKGIRVFRRGEAGVLTDRPWLRRVHCGVRPAQERRLTRIGIEKVETVDIAFGIARLHNDAFGRLPSRRALAVCSDGAIREVDPGEVRYLTHLMPRISCAARSAPSTSEPA